MYLSRMLALTTGALIAYDQDDVDVYVHLDLAYGNQRQHWEILIPYITDSLIEQLPFIGEFPAMFQRTGGNAHQQSTTGLIHVSGLELRQNAWCEKRRKGPGMPTDGPGARLLGRFE